MSCSQQPRVSAVLQIFYLLGYTHWKLGDASSGLMIVSSVPPGVIGCWALSPEPKKGCWIRSSKGLNGARAAILMSCSKHDLRKPMLRKASLRPWLFAQARSKPGETPSLNGGDDFSPSGVRYLYLPRSTLADFPLPSTFVQAV